MKKSTKGALAAAAAGTMLVGGYGSLATWTSQKTIEGGTISAGELSLTEPSCDGTVTGTHEWQYGPGKPFAFTDAVVPGDTISKVCQVTLIGTGKNLKAKLTVAGAGVANDGAITFDTDLTSSAKFSVDGGADQSGFVDFTSADFVSPNDSTKDVLVTITVQFPATVGSTAGEGDRDQNASAVLNALTITANQT